MFDLTSCNVKSAHVYTVSLCFNSRRGNTEVREAGLRGLGSCSTGSRQTSHRVSSSLDSRICESWGLYYRHLVSTSLKNSLETYFSSSAGANVVQNSLLWTETKALNRFWSASHRALGLPMLCPLPILVSFLRSPSAFPFFHILPPPPPLQYSSSTQFINWGDAVHQPELTLIVLCSDRADKLSWNLDNQEVCVETFYYLCSRSQVGDGTFLNKLGATDSLTLSFPS